MLADFAKYVLVKCRYPGVDIRTHRIGSKVRFGVGCKVLYDAEINSGVALGDYTYVNAGTIIGSGSVGKFCSIGYQCQIGMPEHPTDYLSTSSRTYSSGNIFQVDPYWNDFPSPPVIENDVWIGSRAIVGQGVRIGNGAIVAAGAVVTRDVGEYSIVGGVPAKEIRKRFDDNTIKKLAELNWWDKSIDEILEMKPVFLKGSCWMDSFLK